jgi:hypothetical protein
MSGRHPQGGSPQDPTSRFNQTANSQGHGQQFHAQLPSGYPYQSAPSIQGYDPSTQAARTTNDGSVYGKSQSYAQHQYPLGQQPLNVSPGQSHFRSILLKLTYLLFGTFHSLLTAMTARCLILSNIIRLNSLLSFSLNPLSSTRILLN